MSKLIIVESPNKIKKVKKYAGDEFEVIASVGHFKRMKNEGEFNLGIEVNGDFEHLYENDPEKKAVVKNIKEKAKKADEVLIATDPDREGEIIGWHIFETIKNVNKNIKRITFNSITEKEIKNAISNPRDLDFELVDAAKAREGIDKMIGFMISPVVKKQTESGTSAGRVQTPTLRMIVERKEAQDNFEPTTTFSIFLKHIEDGEDVKFEVGKKIAGEYFKETSLDRSEIKSKINELNQRKKHWTLEDSFDKEKSFSPPKVFDTSDVLINAAKQLKFDNDYSMKLLNILFTEGLITYPRTDLKEILDKEFISETLNLIQDKFGIEGVQKARSGKKDKTAQEAHEGIRPTNIWDEDGGLQGDELKMYSMIRERTINSFLPDYIERQIEWFFKQEDEYRIRTVTKQILSTGWKAFVKDLEAEEVPKVCFERELIIAEEEVFEMSESTTKPPIDFTEATIIKAMKSAGIGRPSTYAMITSTIKNRGYVKKKGDSLLPTKTGIEVVNFLKTEIPNYFEIKFTAQIEQMLDQIAVGKIERIALERKFYEGVKDKIERFGSTNLNVEVTGEKCPKCNSDLAKRKGKYGDFESCTNYPNCKYIKPKEGQEVVVAEGKQCPECKGSMVNRKSKNGKEFFGCVKFPKCKGVLWE